MGIPYMDRRSSYRGGGEDAASYSIQAAVLQDRLDQLGNIIVYSSKPV